MKEAIQVANYFFVDESGDPTFYDRRGNLIVGQGGCSPILILGFIETCEPTHIRRELDRLHKEVAADKYLEAVPSMLKTNVAFHAKNDVPEVRQAVFRCIAAMQFKAQFVVARKIERVFRNTCNSSEGKFYDHAVTQLFQNTLIHHPINRVYLSRRGVSTRQEPLESAVRLGISNVEAQGRAGSDTKITVLTQTPVGEPCLQVIDYMNWAVYRAFVKGEMRFYTFVEDRVSLLVDLYDSGNYPRNWYGKDNPFDIKKASPL
ncbi:MAG: DUF3800 domain-containing protein [Phycisphaerae bacterium]|nr:DUF3800 domain-containing protein [Phycisphaerae bacterium]